MSKVLMFHRVLPKKLIRKPNAYATFGTLISQEYFEEILKFIVESGFIVASVSELAELAETNAHTDNYVVLTFDDGYSDNFDYAFPSLQKFNLTATFFPVVEPCKENSILPLDLYYQSVDALKLSDVKRDQYIFGNIKKDFYWTKPAKQMEELTRLFPHHPKKGRLRYMDSQQLKILAQNGFEIGSHGLTHSIMIAEYMDEQRINNELIDSKEWLEGITGRPVTTYCFPAGRYNSRILEYVAEAGYTSACLVKRNEYHIESMMTFERIFVKSNSLNELKLALIGE